MNDEFEKSLYQLAKTITDDLEFWERNFNNKPREKELPIDFFGNPNPYSNLRNTIKSNNYLALIEPFIAYAKVKENDITYIYYFCRREEVAHSELVEKKENVKYVSYKAPLGILASKEAGTKVNLKILNTNRSFEIIEKNIFVPKKLSLYKWDAINNRIEISLGKYSIDSLLKLITEKEELTNSENNNIFPTIYEDDPRLTKEQNITKGIKRNLLKKVEFRDQPILDEIQDSIFRLPLNSKIIIEGTAGTGKTTVILKRLSQKLVYEFLSENEKNLIKYNDLYKLFNDKYRNWILFTPNPEIKGYIKEELNLEGIPASEKNLSTWDNMRSLLAREFFITKVGENPGTFFRTKKKILKDIDNKSLSYLKNKFRKFYFDYIKSKIKKNYTDIIEYKKNNNYYYNNLLKSFYTLMDNFLKNYGADNLFSLIKFSIGLYNLKNEYRNYRKNLNNDIIKRIEELYNKHRPVYNDILNYLNKVHDEYKKYEQKELYEEIKRYIRKSIIFYSKNTFLQINDSNNKIYFDIVKYLKKISVIFNENFFYSIGKRLYELNMISLISNNIDIILKNLPKYYKLFRNNTKEKIYLQVPDYGKNISELEIDIILNEILSNSLMLLKKNKMLLEKNTNNKILEFLKHKYYLQVIIDEAVDFSEVQINCMKNLVHPNIDSIILSGDIMQRITKCGIKSWEVLNENGKDNFKIYTLKRVYRQSPKMLNLIKKIYKYKTNKVADFETVYESDKYEPDPVKFKYNSKNELKEWLVSKINSLYKIYDNQLPTIALFVPKEDDIGKLFNLINEDLYQNSIDLEECVKGKIGENNKVKIFSIEYIKGMEFEAVFIIDIDKIEIIYPELINEFIYVGLTRAASFLAIAYSLDFPRNLKYIEDDFSDN